MMKGLSSLPLFIVYTNDTHTNMITILLYMYIVMGVIKEHEDLVFFQNHVNQYSMTDPNIVSNFLQVKMMI